MIATTLLALLPSVAAPTNVVVDWQADPVYAVGSAFTVVLVQHERRDRFPRLRVEGGRVGLKEFVRCHAGSISKQKAVSSPSQRTDSSRRPSRPVTP